MSWGGDNINTIRGDYIWYNNISNEWIFSKGSTHMVLNGTTWEPTSFSMEGGGAVSFNGYNIWYNKTLDSRKTYLAGSAYYKLSSSRYWSLLRSTGWPTMSNSYLWYTHDFDSDGNTYYSTLSRQGVITNAEYSSILWGSVKPDEGSMVWHSANHTYYSATNGNNYVLNDDKTAWLPIYWPGLNIAIYSGRFSTWHDGSTTYYSHGTTHLKLVND
jgi:hypothetical protein